MKWAVDLSEFDITYQNRIAFKSQVLVDLVAEMTFEATTTLDNKLSSGKWILQVDGSWNVKGSRVGVYLKSPTREVIK